MVFPKKYYVFHSNTEKNPVLTKFFIIKNKNLNLINLTVLFNNVDLIFVKKFNIFQLFPGRVLLKFPIKKISQKNMNVKVGGIKIILNKFYLIYEE